MEQRKAAASLQRPVRPADEGRKTSYTQTKAESGDPAARYVEAGEKERPSRLRFTKRRTPIGNNLCITEKRTPADNNLRFNRRQTPVENTPGFAANAAAVDVIPCPQFPETTKATDAGQGDTAQTSGAERVRSASRARPIRFASRMAPTSAVQPRFPRNDRADAVQMLRYEILNGDLQPEGNNGFVNYVAMSGQLSQQNPRPDHDAGARRSDEHDDRWPSLLEEVTTNSELYRRPDFERDTQLIEFQEVRGWSGSRF
jgi:hypothetical protein